MTKKFVLVKKNNEVIGKITQDDKGNVTVEPVSAEYKDELKKLVIPFPTFTGGGGGDIKGDILYDQFKDVQTNDPLWLQDLACAVPSDYIISAPMESGEENSKIKQ